MSHERFPDSNNSPELPTRPQLEGFHVTDDPEIVLNALGSGIPLDRGIDVSPSDDLLASGLYFSEAPQLWVGRASNKWKFTSSLSEQQRGSIAQTILQSSKFVGDWYLTSSEKERAARWLEHFIESGDALYLQFLADQPYNVASWKPEFLSPFGVTNSETPHIVPVRVQGLFADISSARISGNLIRTLKQSGHDGVFYSNIGFLPQAVVWNNAAVVQFGEYGTKE